MRLSVFVALVVATFVATCISFTSAENVAQIRGVDSGNNVQDGRRLATADEWWLADTNTEERLSGGSFVNKMKGKLRSVRTGGTVKTEKLNNAQVKTITREVATTVKKDRKTWPMIKKGLKILYGALLAGLIIVGVEAMLSEEY
ncbi:hypothetical protein F441_13492 [Phytophthora nicotianae CJ01A1]|uniref:RxLR effector protein n=3 Tax=Phytophthora nicotianae TaxID=4792 RepID=W2R5K6_PHYN3|nr:hypothetical protein PPTG_03526 [Phytophthora nicotianae INRA-310]ETL34689.1 hypothetical protein L916_13127 [Phytophthora nicotianae]ETP10966.1 hypothetical protein F441_13492 [Phytophthora nicotianae CJ01A1]KUF92262.1 hypothetical protein AM588_10006369 [Phytophthora nicotianae]ETL87961.1 hypothetical protein L917_12951 [Phytophthora nicotianae]ETN20541.1 hypothetical protein PPTG_03526 [Phytophthora nicotianae INRA-310]